MAELTIEQIIALDDAHSQEVTVPQWDTTCYLFSMTAEERAEVEKRFGQGQASKDPAAFRCAVLTQAWKKKDGSPFGTPDQIRQAMTKNAAAIELLFEAACDVNGFTKKDVEELEKN